MSDPGGKNIRVLIAEDDYLVGETVRGLLEEAGYVVVGAATNGSEAVEMTCSLQPDVVLMDIEMPGVDGIQATRLICERCPTPVVALTAHETENLVDGASEAGVGAYLVKPPRLRELERAITIARARFDDMMELRRYAAQLERRVQERTAELEAQYARLDVILRNTSDGIVVTDGQGKIIQANPVAQDWLAKTLSPEDAALLREAVRELARQAASHRGRAWQSADGERLETVLELTGLDLELRAAPVVGEGVNGIAVVVDIHDVSHLKALNRMKTRFVANISHELRTPIATIKLYVHLMQKQPEKWKQYLETLAQEADHQARLVEDILQISRIDSGRLEMNPLSTLLDKLTQEAVANYRELAQERGLTLERRASEPELAALVDPDRMAQVLDNLVENAVQYTLAGGKVLVSTERAEAEQRVWATVTVADTGIGIPEQDMPHLFDRFFRGQGERQIQVSGTGLGLAIVKEIVELHGGRVTVESQVGVGTTFIVWLPLAEQVDVSFQ